MNQKVKWNYQLVDQDHIHTQIQFWKKYNLPKYQGGSQNFNFGQVQMDVLKLNRGFQNNMILGSNRRVRNIRIDQRLRRKNFLTPIDQFAQY